MYVYFKPSQQVPRKVDGEQEGEVLTLPDNIRHGEVCPIKTQVCLNNLQVMGFRKKVTRSSPAAGPLNGYTRMTSTDIMTGMSQHLLFPVKTHVCLNNLQVKGSNPQAEPLIA